MFRGLLKAPPRLLGPPGRLVRGVESPEPVRARANEANKYAHAREVEKSESQARARPATNGRTSPRGRARLPRSGAKTTQARDGLWLAAAVLGDGRSERGHLVGKGSSQCSERGHLVGDLLKGGGWRGHSGCHDCGAHPGLLLCSDRHSAPSCLASWRSSRPR